MSRSLEFTIEAVTDVLSAVDWYDRKERGLGARFSRKVESVLTKVRETPRRFPSIHREVRRALTHPFPYQILFVDERQVITVIGVVHGHRGSKFLRRRLRRG